MAGEDATQRALGAILQGMETDRGGRVPRPMDLENKTSFLNFARGAISSIISIMAHKRQFRCEHKPWGDEKIAAEDPSMLSPSRNAELSDLKDQLFRRLRTQAPRRLWRTIEAWEAVFTESDRIPARGHRRYVSEVRSLAQTIVKELGGIR
jgi:hypothetical protein